MKNFLFWVFGLVIGVTGFTTGLDVWHSMPRSRALPGESGVRRESTAVATMATMNDRILVEGSKYWIRWPVREVGTWLMAGPGFRTMLGVDCLYGLGMGGYEGLKGDYVRMEGYLLRARKCALGAAAGGLGVFSADLVSHHFIPDARVRSSVQSYGKLYSAEVVEVFPERVDEVAEIVRRSERVVVAGRQASQGKQALPGAEEAVLLNMTKMNGVKIDSDRRVAVVQGGATWKDVQNAANEHALAVRVMQASNIFTVGGSLAINCHGWDHRSGAVGETVLSVTIVNGGGKVVRLTKEDELFHYVVGGMGGFGVIVEAEIGLVPNAELRVQGTEVAPKNYLRYFRELERDPKVAMHYYRLSLEPGALFRQGIAVNYLDDGKVVSGKLEDEPVKGGVVDRIELHVLRRLNWTRGLAWKEEKREALKEMVLSRNEAMRPPINAIFNDSGQDVEWLQEYFVPGEELEGFLAYLSKVLDKHGVPVFNASVRYVGNNDSKAFNYTKGEEMFAVVLFFHQSLQPKKIKETEAWVKQVVDFVLDKGGTYYLAYQNFPTVEQFRASYPNWKEIAKKKEEFDPRHVFVSGFYDEYLFGEAMQKKRKEKLFHAVFDQEIGMREGMKDFIGIIFKQLDEEKLLSLVDEIRRQEGDDERIYEVLHERIGEASPGKVKKVTQALQALGELQEDLSNQARELIGDRPLQGYVEIGYPGRMIRPLKNKLNLSGPFYVVNEQESLMDYVESGFPRPYQKFVPMHEYEPISPDEIGSGSVDLVAMFIGLHHIPPHKLDAFLRSIHRILRPGGTFLLMDHDAGTQEMKDFVAMVHTIFNAGTGVSPAEERAEVRNFQSLEHWKGVLEKNGLVASGKSPLIREGDPTLNSLMTFEKKMGVVDAFAKDPGVWRSEMQTYLTAPEWQNVRSSQAYAEFIEHTPFYMFPYFSEIKNFWHVYASSWKAATERHSISEVVSSEYTLMNTFIGVMMTVEYGIKGVISAPIAWFYTAEENKQAETFHALVECSKNVCHIEIPRYREGTREMIKIAESGGQFLSISGQSHIQLDVLMGNSEQLELPVGAKWLYETGKSADPDHKFVALDVEVSKLSDVIRSLKTQNLEISYIHEY